MNDKQTSALILAVFVAFVFWLNNTNRLKWIMTIIRGQIPQTVPELQSGQPADTTGTQNNQDTTGGYTTSPSFNKLPALYVPIPQGYDTGLRVVKQINNTMFGYGVDNTNYGN